MELRSLLIPVLLFSFLSSAFAADQDLSPHRVFHLGPTEIRELQQQAQAIKSVKDLLLFLNRVDEMSGFTNHLSQRRLLGMAQSVAVAPPPHPTHLSRLDPDEARMAAEERERRLENAVGTIQNLNEEVLRRWGVKEALVHVFEAISIFDLSKKLRAFQIPPGEEATAENCNREKSGVCIFKYAPYDVWDFQLQLYKIVALFEILKTITEPDFQAQLIDSISESILAYSRMYIVAARPSLWLHRNDIVLRDLLHVALVSGLIGLDQQTADTIATRIKQVAKQQTKGNTKRFIARMAKDKAVPLLGLNAALIGMMFVGGWPAFLIAPADLIMNGGFAYALFRMYRNEMRPGNLENYSYAQTLLGNPPRQRTFAQEALARACQQVFNPLLLNPHPFR